MAGKPKQGLDYAGWATNIFDGDTKIDRLLDAQGWIGFSIYFYLCQMAYKFDGYFYRWAYADSASTARRMGGGIKSGTVEETVRTCLQIGLFDQRLFDEWSILTSRGIQRRFFAAIKDKRRKAVITDYWLLEEEEKTEGLEKCAGFELVCSKDGDVCGKDEEKCRKDDPERKEKKMKENKRKEKDTPRRDAPAGISLQTGDDISLSDGTNGLGSKRDPVFQQEGENKPDFTGLSEGLAAKVQDWLQYKRERREPYKPMGLKALLTSIQNQAERHGDQAVIELIDQCMAANYRGIIWDRLSQGRPFETNRQQPLSFSEIVRRAERGEIL